MKKHDYSLESKDGLVVFQEDNNVDYSVYESDKNGVALPAYPVKILNRDDNNLTLYTVNVPELNFGVGVSRQLDFLDNYEYWIANRSLPQKLIGSVKTLIDLKTRYDIKEIDAPQVNLPAVYKISFPSLEIALTVRHNNKRFSFKINTKDLSGYTINGRSKSVCFDVDSESIVTYHNYPYITPLTELATRYWMRLDITTESIYMLVGNLGKWYCEDIPPLVGLFTYLGEGISLRYSGYNEITGIVKYSPVNARPPMYQLTGLGSSIGGYINTKIGVRYEARNNVPGYLDIRINNGKALGNIDQLDYDFPIDDGLLYPNVIQYPFFTERPYSELAKIHNIILPPPMSFHSIYDPPYFFPFDPNKYISGNVYFNEVTFRSVDGFNFYRHDFCLHYYRDYTNGFWVPPFICDERIEQNYQLDWNHEINNAKITIAESSPFLRLMKDIKVTKIDDLELLQPEIRLDVLGIEFPDDLSVASEVYDLERAYRTNSNEFNNTEELYECKVLKTGESYHDIRTTPITLKNAIVVNNDLTQLYYKTPENHPVVYRYGGMTGVFSATEEHEIHEALVKQRAGQERLTALLNLLPDGVGILRYPHGMSVQSAGPYTRSEDLIGAIHKVYDIAIIENQWCLVYWTWTYKYNALRRLNHYEAMQNRNQFFDFRVSQLRRYVSTSNQDCPFSCYTLAVYDPEFELWSPNHRLVDYPYVREPRIITYGEDKLDVERSLKYMR